MQVFGQKFCERHIGLVIDHAIHKAVIAFDKGLNIVGKRLGIRVQADGGSGVLPCAFDCIGSDLVRLGGAGISIFGMQGHVVGAEYIEIVRIGRLLASVDAVDRIGCFFNMFI